LIGVNKSVRLAELRAGRTTVRQLIVKLGHFPSVLLITVFSCVASIFISMLLTFSYIQAGIDMNSNSRLTISFFVPIILAPPLSWFIIGLLLKIDQLEAEMRHAATFDLLTGLLNRRAFMEQASETFDLAAKEGFEVSVLLVDLDHFKSINDHFGHVCGDNVLTTLGGVITQIARQGDVVGRLGGEEFAFLLPKTSEDEAWAFSERLHKTINHTVFDHDGCAVRITISVGIVTLPIGTVSSLEKSLSMADKAMYYAKNSGRNRSAIYDEAYEESMPILTSLDSIANHRL
jgi:diguanylate cyclase (GGDEF)-like protein